MAEWNYQREEREEQTRITGKQRCVIESVEEKVSKSGNDMIEIRVRPSGCRFTVKSWLVAGKNFNRNATSFFDSFPEIGDGNFNFIEWPGSEGAAMFGEDENGYLKVKWFLTPEQAADLPPFEGVKPERQIVTKLEEDSDPDDGLPF